ncbi:hypothetical protein QR680_011950 [Steinernema hermaphroditum]|uniref:Uncharacterized protein n=1 Tax=Steinernema hermaphroditum TaxID=289476 RepID=A0AA39LYY9_9BILA|nr:hypothetical protein QR680_011950 [Steinernema hermaphroditum]
MKYVYFVLALFLPVSYGCQPVVNNPSLNPVPEDVQKTDAPTEATTMSTPGGATDEGPKDEDEDLKKLIEKLMAAEQSLKTANDDFQLAEKVRMDREAEYYPALNSENVKAIEQQIDEKMAADKAAQDLAAAEDKLKSAKGMEEQANEVLNAAKRQRDEEDDPAMKPAREQAAKDHLPSVEELQKKKEEAKKKNKEAVESLGKAMADLVQLNKKKKQLEEEVAELKREIEELKAKKKE